MSHSTRIGTVVGGYRIESLLGRGGMSVVYLAEHMRLGRKVALKVLAPALAEDHAFRERFIRESQRAAELDHPNVIPIYDAGEVEGGDADGLLYIAMRYVQGSDLKSLLERDGRLTVGRTMFLLEQVASALDAAHDRDLIHRDVKPPNILVAEPSDHVYLTDFGVVKHTTSRGPTRTGIFVGTADYAAPEQLEGLPLDRRTDVYALGCVLYECLVGRPPFDREAEVAVMHAHLTEPPPRMTDTQPHLPKALDRVVATAMAKSKDDRFSTCPELVEAARAAVLQRQPAPAAPSVATIPEAAPPHDGAPPPTAVPEPQPAAAPTAVARTTKRQWLLTALLVALAAAASGVVVFLLAHHSSGSPGVALPPGVHRLEDLVPQPIWNACRLQNPPRVGAVETAVCVEPKGSKTFYPDRLEISTFASTAAVRQAYEAERARARVKRGRGTCSGLSWGGEGRWVHGPGKPGGSRFCYFAGNDAVIVWTHQKFGQASHTDILASARKGGSDHPDLFDWWNYWHHRIGKIFT